MNQDRTQHTRAMSQVSLPAVEVLEQAAEAVALVDGRQQVVFFNDAAERLWQRSRSEAEACGWPALMGGQAEASALGPGTHDVVLQRPDGSRVQVAMTLSLVRRGNTSWTAVFASDVSVIHAEQERLRQRSLVVDETDNAIMVGGPDTRLVHVNPGFTRLLGYELADVLGKRPLEVLAGPHTDVQAVERTRGDLAALASYRTESLIYTKTGQPLWVAAVVNPVFDGDGRLRSVVGVLSDITLTKMHEVLQHRVLDAMVRELPLTELMALVCTEVERIAPELVCSVLEVDTQGLLHPLAGPSLPEALGDALEGLPIDAAATSCGRAAASGEPEEVVDIASDPLWHDHRDLVLPLGLVASWSCPIKASNGTVLGSFALYFRKHQSVSPFQRRLVEICVQLCALALERERVKAHLHQLASFDRLTSLPNRATLQHRAEPLLAELAQTGAPLALLCIGLDRFKLVNETRGHGMGDALLREIARRVLQCVRAIDLTGRLDGDQFVVVLPSCSVEQAALAANRLLSAIAGPLVLEPVTLNPTASIGVAMFPHDGRDIDLLLQHANLAMVQAKSQGRGTARFFNDEMQRRTRERAALETALREGLLEGSLRLHYQPQVDCRSAGVLHGVEALARWSHPQWGEVPPVRFIPLAEEAGLIEELGRWALAEACRQMAAWRREGVAVPRVAVNLSARNFQDPQLPALVEQLLRGNGLASADLTLEMTESVMLDAGSPAFATIEALHAMGVLLSLDDFGTGYSSLSYLHRLPIHELKLDQSFVRDLSDSATARALTNTIVRIGDSLRLTVVAEGVETQAQADLLAAHGCVVQQGYLFARPMPADALATWLARHS